MKTIITIGRQFGSGGKEIGIRVAKELGIPFYDKELLQEAAKKSGLCEQIFESFDERPKSLLYSIAMDSYMFALPGGVGLSERVFEMDRTLFAQALALLEACPCRDGCPSCVGPVSQVGEGGKADAIAILKEMLG